MFFFASKICSLIYFNYLCSAIEKGAIAQLVEQRTENPCVPGSIPGGTTLKKSKKKQTPDFQKKSGVFCFPARRKKVRNMTVSGVPKGGAEKVERKSPPNQILSN